MRPRVRWGTVLELLASLRDACGSTHLTDRELVRVVLDAESADGTVRNEHLAACSRCAARITTLRGDLDRIATVAEAAFDEALPAWRIARQRRRIQERILRVAGGSGSARILQFPTLGIPAASNAYPIRRRLSLAAAAGVLVTVGIVQLIDGYRQPAAGPQPASAIASPQPVIGPPDGQPQSVGDEQFMRELEEALNTSRVGPLVALDEMTPRVRAAAIDIR